MLTDGAENLMGWITGVIFYQHTMVHGHHFYDLQASDVELWEIDEMERDEIGDGRKSMSKDGSATSFSWCSFTVLMSHK